MARVTLTYDIPDNKLSVIMDNFAAYHGYDPNGGQTQGQFIKDRIAQFIRDSVRAHRATQQADAARDASIADTDAIAIT